MLSLALSRADHHQSRANCDTSACKIGSDGQFGTRCKKFHLKCGHTLKAASSLSISILVSQFPRFTFLEGRGVHITFKPKKHLINERATPKNILSNQIDSIRDVYIIDTPKNVCLIHVGIVDMIWNTGKHLFSGCEPCEQIKLHGKYSGFRNGKAICLSFWWMDFTPLSALNQIK